MGFFDRPTTRILRRREWIPSGKAGSRNDGGDNGNGNGGGNNGGGNNGGGTPSPPGGGGPKLTSPTGTATSGTEADMSVSTNGSNGTRYWVVTATSTAPTRAQVKAGQDSAGGAAADSGSQAVTGNGVQNITGGATGLAGETEYWAHFMHERANGSQSGVATSASFTTQEADPNFDSVVLLVSFNGTDGQTTATDDSNSAHALTFAGNAQIDDDVSNFGVGSLILDGTGDYVTALDSPDWLWGDGEFTIELFIRYNSVADAEFVSQWDAQAISSSFKFGRTAASGLVFNLYTGATPTLNAVVGAWTPSANTWYHLAVDRDSNGDVRTYVDGTMIATDNIPDASTDESKQLSIGRIDHGTPRYFNGWVNEIRITKGVARYASDSGFTKPTAAFPRS